jgi:uncharacterized repeat protein (TIGR02543 family)
MSKVFKNKKHNRVWAMVLTVCLVLGVIGGTGLVSFIASLHVKAEDKLLDPDTGKFYVKDDDFMVLEIVPDESMAQFGYLVKGQEPVDMDAVESSEEESVLEEVLKTTQELSSTTIKEFGTLKDAYKEEYDRTHDSSNIEFTTLLPNKENQYGTYVKVNDGSGKYNLELSNIGIVEVAPGSGHFDYIIEKQTEDKMDNLSVKTALVNSLGGSVTTAYLDETENKYSDVKFFEVVPRTSVSGITIPDNASEYVDDYDLYEKTTPGSSEAQWTLLYQQDRAGNMGGQHYRLETDNKYEYELVNSLSDSGGYMELSSGNPDSKVLSFRKINDGEYLEDYLKYERETHTYRYFKLWIGGFNDERPYFSGDHYVWDASESKRIAGIGYVYYYYYTYKRSNSGEYTVDQDMTSSESEKKYYVRRYNPVLFQAAGFNPFTPRNNNEKKNTYVDYYGNDFQPVDEPSIRDIKQVTETGSKRVSDYITTRSAFRGASEGEQYIDVKGEKKIKKYLAPVSGGNYDLIFYYKMVPAEAGEPGDYNFEGLSYNDNSIVKSQYHDEWMEFAPYTDASMPAVIKGFRPENVWQATLSEQKNQDPFKKWTLGLGYVNGDPANGYDYDSLIFTGWYTEPECINPATIEESLKENAVLYAGWRISYGDGTSKNSYRVTFDKNVADDEGYEVTDMPFEYVDVYEGGKLVEPYKEPKRVDKVFTGWYTATPTSISNAVNYSAEVTKSFTLYAGWRDITEDDKYHVVFNANMGPGRTETNTGLRNMPSTITGSAIYYASGAMVGVANSGPSTPSRTDGYSFGGWYLESSCVNRFNIGDRVTRSFDDNVIELYAKWVKNTEKRTIKFKGNKPSGVTASVQNMPDDIEVNYGGSTTGASITIPTLKGNVEDKLSSKDVKVITVTPADLKGKYTCDGGTGSRRNGESLIKRADYIVINESCSDQLRVVWGKYHRSDLFPKSDSDYGVDKTHNVYTFNNDHFTGNSRAIDLTWNQTLELLKKIAGTEGYKPCPVIFDYSIYNRITTDPSNGEDIVMGIPYSDGGNFGSAGNVRSYKDNIYKFYLLATQANPITLYNAYFYKDHRIDKDNGNIIPGAGWTYSDVSYWNEYTLVPFNAIISNEFRSDENGTLGALGFTLNTTLRIGDNRYSSLYNRFFVYGYEKTLTGNDEHPASVAGGYLTPIFSSLLDDGGSDVKEYYGREDAFTPAQISYYLLKNSSTYANFTTDINILEIEPCDTYKNSDFWFWYISRTLPNYLGSPKVTGMTSAEFNGSVLDIESNFDIVYFGVNDNTLNRDLLFNVDEYSESADDNTRKTLIDWIRPRTYSEDDYSDEFTVEVTQTLYTKFQKKQTKSLSSNFVISDSYSARTPYPFVKTWDPAIVKDGVFQVNKDLGIYAEWFGLSTYVKETAIFGAPYFRYKDGDGNYVKYNEMGVRSSISAINNYIGHERGYSIPSATEKIEKGAMQWALFIPLGIDDYRETHFYIDQFYWGVNGTATEDNWVTYNATPENGITVYAGDTIRFIGQITEPYNRVLKYNYVYTHVGPSMFYSDTSYSDQDVRNVWEVLRDWLVGVFGGSNTSKNYEEYVRLLGTLTADDSDTYGNFVFSGNDITKSKYDELVRYANIGHPIVFGRDVLKSNGEVNERMIDSSTNIYKLINKIKNDHQNSYFEAMKTDKDDIFATTIQYFAFSLDVVGPTEYSGVEGGDAAYVERNDDGSTTLEFELKITNNSGRNPSYGVAVYVDTNSDGKFSPEDEIIEDIEVTDVYTNAQISDTNLRGGARYRLKADIGAEYEFGIAYWQLVVTDLTTRKQSGAEGKAGIKSPSTEKKLVYVLQIEPNSGSTVPVPTYEERTSGTPLSGVKNTLNNLTKDLKDYELIFCRKTLDQMKTIVTKSVEQQVVGKGTLGEDITLSKIDVIIVGCGEAYEMNDDETIKKIKNYIAAGKPIIFTKDTVSYRNLSTTPSSSNTVRYLYGLISVTYNHNLNPSIPYWGYKETQAFRELLGMDRFGVMKTRGNISAIEADPTLDRPYVLDKNQSEYYTCPGEGDTSGRAKKALVQGFSNTTTGLQFTKTVNNIVPINEGQITTYPYALTAPAITIAPTSAGYYQLDLDKNDTTVWYTLTSDQNSGDPSKHTSGSNEFYWGADATNNYYLYTKGNITYSGIGKASPTLDELKLFVNTIVASSRTGVQPTVPIITNVEKASTRRGFDYLYIDFDASLARNDETSTPFGEGIHEYWISDSDHSLGTYFAKRVYFTLKDYSIIEDKKMIITCKPAVLSGTSILADIGNASFAFRAYQCDGENGPYKDTPPSIKFKYKSDAYGGSEVETGNYYYVDIPISDNYYQYFLYNKITDKTKFSEATYVDSDGNTKTKDFWALDLSDAFYMKLKVVTVYSDVARDDSILTEAEKNAGMSEGYTTEYEPLIGEKGVCIMRRGMFALD